MQRFTRELLDWFYQHRRDMPWRPAVGVCANPYHVLLSEVMLQQTTSATVHDYFLKFTQQWSTLQSLAQADLQDILVAWQGLGYYARARNLHRNVQLIMQEYQGEIPHTASALKQLPGIGDYSAASIAAIAFNQPIIAVDGNVRRVAARLFKIEEIRTDNDYQTMLMPFTVQKGESPFPATQHGDMVQALMELGSLVCTPRTPNCTSCPVAFACQGKDIALELPKQKPKLIQKKLYCVAWVIKNHEKILLQQRPEKGLLGGMSGFPLSDFYPLVAKNPTIDLNELPVYADKLPLTNLKNMRASDLPVIRHVFTHIKLQIVIMLAEIDAGVEAGDGANSNVNLPSDYTWCTLDELADKPLPKLMQKIYHALKPEAIK